MSGLIRVEITCSSEREAVKITSGLLEKRLAACVQTLPILSRFIWDRKIETKNELLLIVKTRADLFNPLCDAVRKLHSYDVPEITAVDITYINGPYANWVRSETAS